ncbi:MAG: PAS domain S-box protein [Anaerolineales bacterium]|nr:PAS domain S-box protein [Anaerolineales bacterium]
MTRFTAAAKLKDMLQAFMAPFPSIRDPEERLGASYAARIVVVLIPLWLILRQLVYTADARIFDFNARMGWVTLLSIAMIILVLFVLSHTRYYRIALWSLALFSIVRVISLALLGKEYSHFHYMLLGMLILVPIEEHLPMILAFVQIIVLLILPILRPDWEYLRVLLDIGLIVMAAPVLAIGAYKRRESLRLKTAALEKSEERFRMLFDSVFDGLVIIENECVVQANQGMGKMFGYGLDELVGKPVNDLFRSSSSQENISNSRTGKFFRLSGIKKDGSEFIAELVLKTQKDGDRISQVMAVRDITIQRKAELQAAQHADELAILSSASMAFNAIDTEQELYDRLSAYLHQLNPRMQGIVNTFDRDGNCLRTCSSFGFGGEQQPSPHISDRMLIGLEQLMKPDILERLASGRMCRVQGDFPALRFTNIPVDVQQDLHAQLSDEECYSIGIVRGGNVLGNVVLFAPVDAEFKRSGIMHALVQQASLTLQRLRAESALQVERDLLHVLMDNIPDGIYFKDGEARYRRLNSAQADLLGADNIDSVIGKRDAEALAPGFVQIRDVDEANVLVNGLPQIDVLEQITSPDGLTRWLSTTEVPLRTETSAIGGLVGISRDITARREVDLQLAKYAEELKRSNDELQHFAYIASHDLQEPLRMIASYMQLLERRCGSALDEDGRTFIHFAVDGARRLQGLINGLLDYSRVETRGKKFALVDLNDLVAEVRQQLSMMLNERGVVLDIGELPALSGDRTQLVQVFQNLISNATKFNDRPDPLVRISAEREAGIWRFAVKDNGIGIDPENHDRIFGIFQRLHTREEYPGTGIGLAVCKKIIERHGGKIWIESELGAGSTFFFTLRSEGLEES